MTIIICSSCCACTYICVFLEFRIPLKAQGIGPYVRRLHLVCLMRSKNTYIERSFTKHILLPRPCACIFVVMLKYHLQHTKLKSC